METQIDGTTGQSVSYADARTLVRKLAVVFRQEFCVGPTSSVVVCSRNDLFFFVPVLAASSLGATVYSVPDYSHGTYNLLAPRYI
jgi:acyl-CoA synthetase (AMP-forming)/AMP-acid ligase II